jgi:putative hydrolase
VLQNRCDVHTHTVASRHAYSTVEENVRAAAERGVDLLGSTDHFSCMTSRGVELDGTGADIRDYQSFLDLLIWPREWHGVTLLRGAEADIVDIQGRLFGHDVPAPDKISGDPYSECLDLEHRVLADTDYAIASVHVTTFCKDATRAQNTQMYVNALQNPKVLIIGHPGRLDIDFEIDPVVEAARDLGKLIEINNSTVDGFPKRVGRCRQIAQRCAELGCSVAVSTDAHISSQVGRFDCALSMLEQIDFPHELIATRSREAFLGALRGANIVPSRRNPLVF